MVLEFEDRVPTFQQEGCTRRAARNEKVLRSERYYGAVSRSFQLPVDIDQGRSSAKFENGVPTLALAKRQASAGSQRLAIDQVS